MGKITSCHMTAERYLDVRRFLQKYYDGFESMDNWLIDRLEFTRTVSASVRGADSKYFESHTRIWYKDDEMVAVVNTEGEMEGEAFFQVSTYDIDDTVLTEMFDFVEAKLGISKNNQRFIALRVQEKFEKAIKEAEARGFKPGSWDEVTSGMPVTRHAVILPEGYSIVDAGVVTPEAHAKAHRLAFGYEETPEMTENFIKGFTAMRKQPDYRTDLDLFVMNPEGEVAAFANIWFDSVNDIAILEPVGTISTERKKGLGKAVIYHGMNLVASLGATHLYVGSDQVFYKRIGLEEVAKSYVYIKEIGN